MGLGIRETEGEEECKGDEVGFGGGKWDETLNNHVKGRYRNIDR